MEYLMRWRILLAARHLQESRAPIVDIAAGVGYESEAAFNRAFKREFGAPPAAWRRQAARSARELIPAA
jgi:AraC-like DNA-binding protein